MHDSCIEGWPTTREKKKTQGHTATRNGKDSYVRQSYKLQSVLSD